MEKKIEQGGGLLGVIFFGVAAINLVRGDDWVAFAIVGFLFGGLTALGRIMDGRANR